MSVMIEATGNSLAAALAAIGPQSLEVVGTEDLLAELRHRLASLEEPMVVRILPFAAPTRSRNAKVARTKAAKKTG